MTGVKQAVLFKIPYTCNFFIKNIGLRLNLTFFLGLMSCSDYVNPSYGNTIERMKEKYVK